MSGFSVSWVVGSITKTLLAEGSSRRSELERKRYYEIARGSVRVSLKLQEAGPAYVMWKSGKQKSPKRHKSVQIWGRQNFRFKCTKTYYLSNLLILD